jgi:hypothetical protein
MKTSIRRAGRAHARWLLPALLLALPAAAQAQSTGLLWAATVHGWMAAMLALMAAVLGLVAACTARAAGQLPDRHDAELGDAARRVRPGSASLRSLLMTLLVLCGTQYPLRQQNWKRGWIDHALLIQCLVVPASLLLTGGQGGLLDEIWHAVLSLELVDAAGLGAAPGPPAGRAGSPGAVGLAGRAAVAHDGRAVRRAGAGTAGAHAVVGLVALAGLDAAGADAGLGLQVINGIAQARVEPSASWWRWSSACRSGRGGAQPRRAGRAEARAGHRARAQAHRRRPA